MTFFSMQLMVTYAPMTPGLKLTPADQLIEMPPTQVIKLDKMISEGREELKEDEEYEDVLEDVREELQKYGSLLALEIPRPNTGKDAAVGFVYAKYVSAEDATKASKAMANKSFGGNAVKSSFMVPSEFDRSVGYSFRCARNAASCFVYFCKSLPRTYSSP